MRGARRGRGHRTDPDAGRTLSHRTIRREGCGTQPAPSPHAPRVVPGRETTRAPAYCAATTEAFTSGATGTLLRQNVPVRPVS